MPALDEVGELPIDSTSDKIRSRQADLLTQRTIESSEAIRDVGKQASRTNPLYQILET